MYRLVSRPKKKRKFAKWHSARSNAYRKSVVCCPAAPPFSDESVPFAWHSLLPSRCAAVAYEARRERNQRIRSTIENPQTGYAKFRVCPPRMASSARPAGSRKSRQQKRDEPFARSCSAELIANWNRTKKNECPSPARRAESQFYLNRVVSDMPISLLGAL